MLLFSGTGDASKEAIGAAVATASGALLNIGVKNPVPIRWDRPMSDADRASFDGALGRFEQTLDLVARAFLDPAYVTWAQRSSPNPTRSRYCA